MINGDNLSKEQRNVIDAFCAGSEWGSIHQTWEWGEFQKTHPGRGKYWVVTAENGGGISGMALLVRTELPFGKMGLICPRGPVVSGGKEVFEKIVEECKKLARRENAVYVRFEPPFEKGRILGEGDFVVDEGYEKFLGWFRYAGFRMAHAHHQPEHTLVVNIGVDEEEILEQMKQKGRYNIRLAKKKGVQVRTGKSQGDVDAFFDLVKTTTKRNHFGGHGREYYSNMLKVLGEKAKLYLAEYEGEVIAGIIVTFYKDEAIYYFGASGNKHRNLMAPYLLQWEAILDAKERGCKRYDFFGIAPEGDEKHPWRKITGFKKKFGGVEVHYMPAQEMVVQGFWYWAMLGAKWLRGLIRGGR